jgi:hypothetical protein
MAATITATSATTTWTSLSTDLTPFRMAAQATPSATVFPTGSMNTPQVASLAVADFASAGTIHIPEEVFRVIELFQFGFGAAPGNQTQATRIAFWPMAALLRAWLNALFSGQASTDPTTYVAPARSQTEAN